jgi:hypothetical protein
MALIRRYFTVEAVPELRPEPGSPENGQQELEVLLPLESFWEARELIERIKYCAASGQTPSQHWRHLKRTVSQYIVHERDRVWFKKNVGS